MYVSCVLGDKLRITMSSIMRWRRREIGLVIDGLLSTGLHERAILADRRLPTDDQNPIEMTDGPNGRLQQVRQSSFKTIKINILNLGQRPRPRRLPRQRFSATGVTEYLVPGRTGSVGLDIGRPDYLGPLVGFLRNEF